MYPTAEDSSVARYWSAKMHAALRDSATARERWTMTLASAPMSYYSAQSARKLGLLPWAPPESPDTFVEFPDDGLNMPSYLAAIEKDLIQRALDRTRGNRNRAADLLGIKRTTLVEKLRRLGSGPLQGPGPRPLGTGLV